MHRPALTSLPWGRPRRELILLAFVGLAALLPAYTVNPQDQSRLCLTQALEHGRVSNDPCLAMSTDRSIFDGHLYSDKAPGMSVLELPGAEALRLRPVEQIQGTTDARTWGVRLLAGGLAFLLGAFLVGRVVEGLAPGRGGAALVAFALGTLVAPLAATNFSHDTSATLAFAAFILAWRKRFLACGLVAGAALFVEYQTAAVLAALAAYALLQDRRALARYLAGLVPGIALLLAYDTAAFGSPFHLSYRYVTVKQQATGFFGIGIPHLHSTYAVLIGNRGLLVTSPVLALAGWGLLELARRRRVEAVLCAAVTVFYVVLDAGYFLPYGGTSPGPRFLVPALPFLAVGLAPAFQRRPRLTGALTAASVAAATALTLIWSSNAPLRHTIWGEIWYAVTQGQSSRLARHLVANALGWTALGSTAGLVVIVGAAVGALVVGLPSGSTAFWPEIRRRPLLAVAIAAAGTALLVGTAFLPPPPLDLQTKIKASTLAALPGDEVDFAVSLVNASKQYQPDVTLTIVLPPSMHLLGAPAHARGRGCKGTSTLTCDLSYFDPHMASTVFLGVRIEPGATSTLRVTAFGTAGGARGTPASVTVTTGAA